MYKKIIFILVVSTFFTIQLHGQCCISCLSNARTFDVYPIPVNINDTIVPLKNGSINQSYSEHITIRAARASIGSPPTYIGVDYVSIAALDGLPSGLSANIEFLGNGFKTSLPHTIVGACEVLDWCINISGVPSKSGSFKFILSGKLKDKCMWDRSCQKIIDKPEITLQQVYEIKIIDPVSIETTAKYNINISPNPTSNSIKIASNSELKNVEILDVLGQKIYSGVFNENTAEIDVSNLSSGVYFVKMIDLSTHLFIKE